MTGESATKARKSLFSGTKNVFGKVGSGVTSGFGAIGSGIKKGYNKTTSFIGLGPGSDAMANLKSHFESL